VAELRPVARPDGDDEASLAALARLGLVTPRRRRDLDVGRRGVRVEGSLVSETIIEERDDRL
jgi:hypothetical protein